MKKINIKKLTVKKLILIISAVLLISAAVTYYFTAARKYRPIYIGNLSKYEDLSREGVIDLDNTATTEYRKGRDAKMGTGGISARFTSRKVFTGTDAIKALANVRTLLGIEEFSFSFIGKRDSSFCLQQFYKGVMVYEGIVEIHVNERKEDGKVGEVYGLYSKYKHGIDMDVKPKISAAKAKKSITLEKGESFLNPISAFRWHKADIMISAKGANRLVPNLMIIDLYLGDPSKTEYRLVWAFAVIDFYKEWYVFVDANTGEVVPRVGWIKSSGTIA